MALSEADTRAKLIDPAIHARGWTEDLVRREESAGAIRIIDGIPRKQPRGRADYTLRVKVNSATQPVAVALIEAKAENLPPTHGLGQAKLYAASKRLNVPFVYSSNGHLFVEYDRFTNKTGNPSPMARFPTPEDLRIRYEQRLGFNLADEAARPLLTPYPLGEATRRYYQDAAIRAVLEEVARRRRAGLRPYALLSLATGAGKTFIAVNLLRRIADAGQLRRALFVCDREELRNQANNAFQNLFGADAAPVSGGNPQLNARVLIATYQTLDVDQEEADANFLTSHYPPDYFSHIVIDECHRSAWGKWSQVLTRNPEAVQIGLTATPRQLDSPPDTPEAQADLKITADNIRHFGPPVYEYDLSQGIEDGYLAACEIVRRDIFLQGRSEREHGVSREDLAGTHLTDAVTGQLLSAADARPYYSPAVIESRLLSPERVQATSRDFFEQLLATGGPEQKSIVFCASDDHADRFAIALNNLYADWCLQQQPRRWPLEFYAFKCTAASGGSALVPDFRDGSRHHFIATTVDLLTTGVDVPAVRNVVFVKYVGSPIAFYQMVGRGARIHEPTGKLMFRVYDYTDATRLFGQAFISKLTLPVVAPDGARPERPEEPSERIIQVEGFDVQVTPAGHLILTTVDGRAVPVTVEEYKERLAASLVAQARTLEDFRAHWIEPAERSQLLASLPDGARSADLVRELDEMKAYDLYDVLADLGYGLAPHTRAERAEAFTYKHARWLKGLPTTAAATLEALADQFARAGTDALENPQVFQLPRVQQAGGLAALRALGRPAEVLRETKQRLFAT